MRASTRAAKLIISPLNGHGQLAGHRLFCLLGRQIAEGLERAVSIIVALDVSEQRLSSFRLGCPSLLLEVQTAKRQAVPVRRHRPLPAKFAVTQLVDKADRRIAWEFLEHLLIAVPHRIYTILTDNGIQFAEQPCNRNTA